MTEQTIIKTDTCDNCKEEYNYYSAWQNCPECGNNLCFDCITDYDGKCRFCGNNLTE